VNGSPELIEVGSYQLTQADFGRADVQRLLRRKPNAFLIYKLWFAGRRETVAGGSRFVFSNAFADCRACKPLADADIAYISTRMACFTARSCYASCLVILTGSLSGDRALGTEQRACLGDFFYTPQRTSPGKQC
jgi:hypothetical protein